MASVTIRQLLAGDFAIFRDTRLEALRLHPEAYSSAYEDWVLFTEQDWRVKLELPVFAAFEGDVPVGLIGLWPQQSVRTAHRATIVMVYVKSHMRGRGIAQKLLQAVYDYAVQAGLAQLELSVSTENIAAKNLYLREGFTEIGCTPNWICVDGKMFDELIMMRPVL